MNEQQRQAVERVRILARDLGRGRDDRFKFIIRDHKNAQRLSEALTTLLALLNRPTTCPSCSTELQGPFCPKCNGDAGGDLPPRPDLAKGAIQVAMGTTTDPDIKPWLQTALDFLDGTYEPLDDEVRS